MIERTYKNHMISQNIFQNFNSFDLSIFSTEFAGSFRFTHFLRIIAQRMIV